MTARLDPVREKLASIVRSAENDRALASGAAEAARIAYVKASEYYFGVSDALQAYDNCSANQDAADGQ